MQFRSSKASADSQHLSTSILVGAVFKKIGIVTSGNTFDYFCIQVIYPY